MTTNDRIQRVVSSSLWSAYGDALGFMSELTDQAGFRRRTGTEIPTKTLPWERRVGGRFGATAVLPAGTYSDDTQLRLATARAIRGDGSFDVEAFAKVELPVWCAYALGAGRSSRAAAVNLAKEGVNWFSNFYQTESASYLESGGNGAAIRIQPHAWCASAALDPKALLLPVVKNTICTHGHPRALIGAVLHAMSVHFALCNRASPSLPDLRDILSWMRTMSATLAADGDLSSFWIPVWEARSGRILSDALAAALHETDALLDQISGVPGDAAGKYALALAKIGGTDEAHRGSATKTALLAALLASEFATMDTDTALVTAASHFHSDTDSIASMAGAILGAASGASPQGELLDRHYIESEARRLGGIGSGVFSDAFHYPDLFRWKPPKTQLDVVYEQHGDMVVSGLGRAVATGRTFESRKHSSEIWQFLTLEFGQTLLIKRRRNLADSPNQAPTTTETIDVKCAPKHSTPPEQLSLTGIGIQTSPLQSIDQFTAEAIAQKFDPAVIGAHILDLSQGPRGVERAIAYAAIIAKARIARQKRREP